MNDVISECDMCIESVQCPASRLRDVCSQYPHWYKKPDAECPKQIYPDSSARIELGRE